MAATTALFNPETGRVEDVDTSALGRAQEASGSHVMSPVEKEQYDRQQSENARSNNFIEGQAAGAIGKIRGLGESVGVPTDAIAGSVGDAFGQGDAVRGYLSDLQKYHGLATGLGEVAGQTAGGIALGELTGGGGATSLPARIAGAGVRGGLENLVIGSTHDINESSLGDPEAAGEKLFANMPKHFAVGVGGGVVGGAVGEGIGAAWSKLSEAAPGVLDRQATKLVGKEFGGGAELGAEVRAHLNGAIPRSAEEVTGALRAEQAGYREAGKAEALAAKETLAARQTTDAAKLSIEQEARRARVLKESQQAIEELQGQHKAAREALSAQHEEASSAFTKLEAERDAARKQFDSLASDLDKVKGAQHPDASSIIREANARLNPGASLTPPSANAQALFNEWADTFASKYAKPGALNFTELQDVMDGLSVMERRQRVVSGWGNDPEVAKVFASLKSATQDEFDRASEATAMSVSEAKSLSAARLRETIPQLDTAVDNARGNVENIQNTILRFDRQSAQEVKLAQREAAAQARQFEKGVRIEDREFDRVARNDERSIPKASKETPVDTLLGKIKKPTDKPGVLEQVGGMGLLASMLHGNVAGAAMSALGGFAAHTAKAQGNLLLARTLGGLGEIISKSDGSISRLAGKAVGRYVRQGASDMVEDDRPSRKELSFDKVAKAVRDADANPLILEQRVRTIAGPWAQQAPQLYASLLSSQQRMQAFLSSKLPKPRIDPYSLTPHLEHDDLSDSEKWDFVQYAKAASDPIQAMSEVVEGNGSPQQVEAVEAIYPKLYEQTRMEVMRRIATLREPLPYERQVNIGTLFNIDTNEVMTGDVQSMLSDMYMARENSEKIDGGSKPRGVNSRLSKSMMSAGDQIAANGEV